MIKRVSLVWRRPDISASQFRELWLGEHAEIATALIGLREYTIDIVPAPPPGMPDGIATMRFATLETLEAAFADASLKERLLRTRDAFAERAEVFLVEENVVFRSGVGNGR